MNENILKIDNSRYEIDIDVVQTKGINLEKQSLKIECLRTVMIIQIKYIFDKSLNNYLKR